MHEFTEIRHPGERRNPVTLVLDVRLDEMESRWAPAFAEMTDREIHEAFFESGALTQPPSPVNGLW